MSDKPRFMINREMLTKIRIDPNDAIKYLESKDASDMNPNHVMALHKLKNKNLMVYLKN